jgi:LacI family transcriptional regulator
MSQMNQTYDNGTPTIADIARVCGVSKMTVSYVINGKSVLKPETRERVTRVMREMNYHPSAAARGLSNKKIQTFGLLLSVFGSAEFVTNPYANALLQGIFLQAQREALNVTLFTSTWESAEASAPQFRAEFTQGIVVVAPPLGSDVLSGLASLNIPVVAIAAGRQQGIGVVDVDNEAGLRMATQHLLDLGHRDITYLTGNDDMASFAPRCAGFVSTMKAAGIECEPEMIQVSSFDGKSAFEQASALLRQTPPPTAIIAGNDNIALAVIDAARCAGLSVPRDVSVVGFDDIPAATLVTPNLTTIHQPLIQIGETAISLLVKRTSQTHAAHDDIHLLPPQLVVRGSSGPPLSASKRR